MSIESKKPRNQSASAINMAKIFLAQYVQKSLDIRYILQVG